MLLTKAFILILRYCDFRMKNRLKISIFHPDSHQIYHWAWHIRIQALPANQIRIKISPTIQLRLEIEKFCFFIVLLDREHINR